MNDHPPPRPTGFVFSMTLTGKLFLWRNGQPVLLRVHGEPRWCLPVFSSITTLERAVTEFDLTHERVKVIVEGDDFLASIRESDDEVFVILDPRKHGEKVRYALVSTVTQ